ncbi:MAG: F0F1 ATP synthase subunit A, partial [Lentisphaerae bacterium]|nr:F0F1 ATP synthase subunit A [Lentisphaerota bacterium]
IEELARPLSLTMRLFGNILAKEIILAILLFLITFFFFSEGLVSKLLLPVPLLLRPAIILLGVLVSFVQAMVFTALAMVYIGEGIKEH